MYGGGLKKITLFSNNYLLGFIEISNTVTLSALRRKTASLANLLQAVSYLKSSTLVTSVPCIVSSYKSQG